VFDKARGVGGRLATRRSDSAKFDHGAQFYRLKEPLKEMHDRWLQKNLVKLWFEDDGESHYIANEGMTALAKDLAGDNEVHLNERATRLRRVDGKWQVTFESERNEIADEVILTCPVPQALELLRSSEVSYSDRLNEVTYTKALVLLIENSPSPFRFKNHGYLEPKNSSIFSIADQREKTISKVNALTVTLGAEISDRLFDAPESEVFQAAVKELKKLSPDFEPGEMQLKKWRYCQVQKTFGELFSQVSSGLYLAGDGFGGASLNGAARSATALAKALADQDSR
jgi:predicted NAD/FAD-dependent oxidoreductase